VIAIRPYKSEDGAALASIFVRAVQKTASRDYTPDQIAAWLADRPGAADIDRKNSDGRLALVATNPDGHAIGWIDLEPDGHIDMLYCDPDFVGQGITSLLFGAAERLARQAGLKRLFVEASETSRPVFAHWGFVVIGRRDFSLKGISIHNYAMEKLL
jgi:putative acetyltransferase